MHVAVNIVNMQLSINDAFFLYRNLVTVRLVGESLQKIQEKNKSQNRKSIAF